MPAGWEKDRLPAQCPAYMVPLYLDVYANASCCDSTFNEHYQTLDGKFVAPEASDNQIFLQEGPADIRVFPPNETSLGVH
jgi:hypothetical protein